MKGGVTTTSGAYLKTVLELEEVQVPARRARLADRIGHSGPTVSQTIGRMQANGLCFLSGSDNVVTLTEGGRRAAVSLLRKHRLLETFFLEIVGLNRADVHGEASRWEHVVSDPVTERIAALLQHPTRDPFGNWIPPGDGGWVMPKDRWTPLSHRLEASTTPITGTVWSIGERIQADPDLMTRMGDAGIHPGALIQAAATPGGTAIESSGQAHKQPLLLSRSLTPWVLLGQTTVPRSSAGA